MTVQQNISQEAFQVWNFKMADVSSTESGDLHAKTASEEPQMSAANQNVTEEGNQVEYASADTGTRQRMISESSLSEDSNAELQETCRKAFNKITEYLNGELTGL